MSQPHKDTLIAILEKVMPFIDDELNNIDKNNGWIKLPDSWVDMLIQLKFNWWEYYENEQLLKAIGSTLFLDNAEARELYENTSMDKIYQEYGDLLESVDDMTLPDESETKELLLEFESANEEQKVELLKPFCKMVLGILSVSFNYLALMIHGRTMCQLVADAKKGDDNAYRCAVQIDRSVLRIEYFQERLMRAQFSGDQDFMDKLSYRLKAPLLQSKIRYKTLLLTFAILEDDGFLSKLPHDELLNICEKVGVYGKAYGVEDVGHLRKRLKDYRNQQKNSKYF